MFKRISFYLVLLFVLVGCFSKTYSFKVVNDVIVIEQTLEDFDLSMIENNVELYLGEGRVDLLDADISVDGKLDLSTVGLYEVTLSAKSKTKKTEETINISVVDTQIPELLIFEKELLVLQGEEVALNAQEFFINLSDGINGLINSRITIEGDYDLSTVGVYPVEVVGIDDSGNVAREDINLRVTDLIDEKAFYLYHRANIAAHGKSLVFNHNNDHEKILNFDTAFNVFTPNYREHFFWLSGLTGDYNNKQSGVKLRNHDGDYYADYSEVRKVPGFKQTKLTIQYETDNYRHYLAESSYDVDGEEVIRNAKFVIRMIEGVWRVEEFYIPN